MDVVFLDANVLFSAAYRPGSGLARLWDLKGIELVASAYAVEEARRNLNDRAREERLETLVRDVRIVPEVPATERVLPEDVDLPSKDVPILAAAISAGASHLLTGDVSHFGPLLGTRVGGVAIMLPGEYLSPS